MATLLPLPEQQWTDANGNPLAAGTVQTLIPGTFVAKQTWQDSGSTILNSNPITLDAAGRAIIYGSGSYRLIVKDSASNLIYDQLTADTAVGGLSWGGTSTGTANAQVIAASSFSQQDGQQISFLVGAGLTNTGGTTIAPGGGSGIAILKDTINGPTALTGGELVAGNAVTLIYDQVRGAFHLVDNPQVINFGGPLTTIASATTTDLGSVTSHNINVTGTTTITSFGSSASTNNPLYQVVFAGSLFLTYNATSMILQGGANILTAASDTAVMLYLGSGNWQMLSYTRGNIAPNASAGISGGFRNMVVTATGATTATVTADGMTLYNVAGNAVYLSAVSQTNTNSGTGAGGLDTGTIATSTWYYIWVIYNPTTTAVSSIVSLSSSAPTMPSGYTHRLRVGALRNAASGGYWRTLQSGRRATITLGTNPTVVPIIASGSVGNVSTPTWVAQSLVNFAPSTAASVLVIASKGGGSTAIVAPSNSYGALGSVTNPPPIGLSDNGAGVFAQNISAWIALESSNVYFAAGGGTSSLGITGWEDNL